MDEPSAHILVVDDHREIRDLLGRYLAKHGLRATVADSAASARKVLQANAIDLVVLDIMMPGEDGLSLCRHLRETGTTPVILLTAVAEETDRVVGLEMGADDYVTKPFNPRELLARINAVLRRQAAARLLDCGVQHGGGAGAVAAEVQQLALHHQRVGALAVQREGAVDLALGGGVILLRQGDPRRRERGGHSRWRGQRRPGARPRSGWARPCWAFWAS